MKIEKQVAALLERILDASLPSVITAYENRIEKLAAEKLLIRERMTETTRPAREFDKTVRTALGFLASPWNLWRSERLEDKRAVLKLAFAMRLQYRCGEGFRTTDLSLPFNMLDQFSSDDSGMAHPTRFERVTFAFGGQSIALFRSLTKLDVIVKPLIYRHFLDIHGHTA
ncbi:hypothetical protein [Nitrobacter winogradskyi]|uniref:Uncharacterized protein n=1 Tax=Nitrobacter winogradskyi TaxID=913 RepID=A0A4Y3WJH7_NITWI|nr:hypothetical protein [Nitrobacter winogradskyi]GEC17506.1 hypothetical protein NWI01_33980 [Nitrobacter winogradskyi]